MVDVTKQPADTTPRRTGPEVQAPPTPGSDLYDWQTINTALRAAGLDGWQIAGASHQPVNQGRTVPNPAYKSIPGATQADLDELNKGVPPFIVQPSADYVIGVVNPQTNQMLKLTMGRQGDAASGYSYTITDRSPQGTIDTKQGGYTGIQREQFNDGHEELWGTNSSTGAFEKMPNQPQGLGTTPKGWNDIKQVDDGSGHLIWVGTDPSGKPLQPVPGAPPPINTAKYVPGSVKQINRNGKLIYVGTNAQTQAIEDIPEYGSENAPNQTTTVGGTIYKTNPKAGQPGEPDLVRVTGVASPNDNDEQWIDAGGGYAKHQVYLNGAWHDDTDTPQKPVSPTTTRAEGAIKPKGEKYWVPLPSSPDKLIEVTADGNGSYTYEPGPNGEPPRTMTVPGIAQPTTVTGAGTDEFLPQRRAPDGTLLPPEKNLNWTPTNVGDRVRQLQQTAQQKQQDLHAQVVSGALTEAAADKQFNDWWDSSIEPAKAEIAQAQQQKQTELEQKAGEQQRLNLATAQQSGQNAVEAYKAQLPNMVGPGFGKAFGQLADAWSSGKPATGIDWSSALTYQMPDLNQLASQVTNQALAHLSPTAAQNMNDTHGVQAAPAFGQQQQPYDYTQSLQRDKYQPGVTTTIATDGTVTINHQAPAQAAAAAPAQVQTAQRPYFPGLQQGYGAAPQQDFRGLAQGAVMPPYQPSF
jgi:hypothetical protein